MKSQRGFTIIELMIATVVFSLVTLVITASILQFSRQYYRGVIASSTQGTARTIIDDVTRSIQFNKEGIYTLRQGSNIRGYCVGGTKRYSFEPYRQVINNAHGLVSDTFAAGCSTLTPPLTVATLTSLTTSNARELLGERMRIAKFSITGSGGLYVVNVKVVYGDDDLLMSKTTPATPQSSADMECKPGKGSEYCAVSELTTTVKKRVN